MNTTPDGNEITIYGLSSSRPLIRQIQRRMEKWKQREESKRYVGRNCIYSIEVERFDNAAYQCWISIQSDTGEWNHQEAGKTIHEAISNTLRGLKPSPWKPIPHHVHESAQVSA